MEKLPFQSLPPKVEVKKKKRKRSKKKEETVSSPKLVAPINFFPNGYKFIEDGELDCIHYHLDVKSVGTIEDDYDMHVTYCNDPD